MKFLDTIANMFRIPDLRKRIFFTLGLLAVYRFGGHIPTPGIDANRLAEFFQQNSGSLFGFIDLFSGGMFRRLTIFALGIMPYITASSRRKANWAAARSRSGPAISPSSWPWCSPLASL
jgi:preprotein translocase subunit SecY